MLGVKLACLAYTDDQRGTLEHLGGTRKAIETLAGGPERARRPLTEILQGLGYVVDRIFSHTAMLGSVRTVDTHVPTTTRTLSSLTEELLELWSGSRTWLRARSRSNHILAPKST